METSKKSQLGEWSKPERFHITADGSTFDLYRTRCPNCGVELWVPYAALHVEPVGAHEDFRGMRTRACFRCFRPSWLFGLHPDRRKEKQKPPKRIVKRKKSAKR